jgi:type I restriction-modification system DNA methylase subunit
VRLAGQAKLGFYPTPLSQVALIAPWLEVEPGKPVRLLDPCAGEGEALEALAQILTGRGAKVETWGVELSPARAEKAATRLDALSPCASSTPRTTLRGWGTAGAKS